MKNSNGKESKKKWQSISNSFVIIININCKFMSTLSDIVMTRFLSLFKWQPYI